MLIYSAVELLSLHLIGRNINGIREYSRRAMSFISNAALDNQLDTPWSTWIIRVINAEFLVIHCHLSAHVQRFSASNTLHGVSNWHAVLEEDHQLFFARDVVLIFMELLNTSSDSLSLPDFRRHLPISCLSNAFPGDKRIYKCSRSLVEWQRNVSVKFSLW